MDLNRLKTLAGLLESVADSPEINAQIEKRLDLLPSHMKTPVLDALEVLKNEGGPISVADWAQKVREIHSDEDMPMAEVLKTATREFSMCVHRTAPKTFEWKVGVEDDEMDPSVQYQVGQQVELTNDALDIMREMGSFTKDQLAKRLMAETGLPQMVVDGFVEHLITSFGTQLDQHGDVYKFKDEEPQTRDKSMNMFKDLVRKREGNA